MRSFRILTAHSKPVLVLAIALVMSACVKPKNHESNIDSTASFYVDEVKPSMDTAETVPGYTLPASRLYTFTACLKDRRTDEALPGAPFVISGGERDQDIHTDKNGCAIWSEKIAFDYLANEKYLPLDRTITAKGSQVGSRALKIAIDPWSLNGKSPSMYDLDHHTLPKEQLATADQARASLKTELAGQTGRKIFVESLPFENSAVATTDGTIVRNLRISLDPRVTLTDIDGNLVNVAFGVTSGKLKVTGALVESTTVGGEDKKTVVAKTAQDVPVVVENGKTSADLRLALRQGLSGSRYSLAIRVTPVDGPKGLKPFEGLFALADLSSMTLTGSFTASLKGSNLDNTFDYDAAVANAQPLSADVMTAAARAQNSGEESFTNDGNGSALKTFEMSVPALAFKGKFDESANRTTLMYLVQVCLKDRSNGGAVPDNVEFSVQRRDKSWIEVKTHSIDPLHGCLTWEDHLSYLYYEPEHFFVTPFTVKHKSGYVEHRQYALDPWQTFRTSADLATTPEFVDRVNREASMNLAHVVVDSVEFNTQKNADYRVDDFLALNFIKHAGLKLNVRVVRKGNYYDNLTQGEPLRNGRYLLRAAYVTPVAGVADKDSHLLVSPMLGLYKVVDADAGFIRTDLDFKISDIHALAARSYLVFELYLLDGAKVPKSDPDLRRSGDVMNYVDRASKLEMPTFATVLNFRNEKDSSGEVFKTSELAEMQVSTDAINGLSSTRQLPSAQTMSRNLIGNESIDHLYRVADANEKIYRTVMKANSSLGLITAQANAEFAFITHEGENSTNDQLLQRNNRLLPPARHAIDALLNILNRPLEQMGSNPRGLVPGFTAAPVTKPMLIGAIRGRQAMDPNLAAQLCGYFFYTQPRTKVAGLQWNKVDFGNGGQWTNLCLNELRSHGPEGMFSIDHRLRVLQVGGISDRGGRSDIQISPGAQVGFSKSSTQMVAYGGQMSTSGISGQLAGFLIHSVGKAWTRIFSAFMGTFGLEVERVHMNSDSTQVGYALSASNTLTVDETDIAINVTKWDDCVVIRPRAQFYQGLQASWHLKLLKGEIGDQPAETLMNRGLMLCEGGLDEHPRVEIERYYSLASMNPAGYTNDLMWTKNLPWLLQLRGQGDFASFLLLASANNQPPPKNKTDFDLTDMPQKYLELAYDKYFAGKMSTMPGFITQQPKIIYRTPGQ